MDTTGSRQRRGPLAGGGVPGPGDGRRDGQLPPEPATCLHAEAQVHHEASAPCGGHLSTLDGPTLTKNSVFWRNEPVVNRACVHPSARGDGPGDGHVARAEETKRENVTAISGKRRRI